MASKEQVKFYLAYWFQLGKKVVIKRKNIAVAPQPIFTLNNYSAAFENCWQQLLMPENRDSYLEGTLQTIDELLTSDWEILPCARCSMPIPMIEIGVNLGDCPCNDLPGWPNRELPTPRKAIDQKEHFQDIQARVDQVRPEERDNLRRGTS